MVYSAIRISASERGSRTKMNDILAGETLRGMSFFGAARGPRLRESYGP